MKVYKEIKEIAKLNSKKNIWSQSWWVQILTPRG